MGWHRDDERELGAEPVIASLSLGAARFFDLRHRDYRNNRLPVQRFELCSGDLIVMRGTTQQHWQHRVPKQLRVDEPRLNLSFRMTSDSTDR
jgi:alkylated DNA repair dioxygenase AlkB